MLIKNAIAWGNLILVSRLAWLAWKDVSAAHKWRARVFTLSAAVSWEIHSSGEEKGDSLRITDLEHSDRYSFIYNAPLLHSLW